MTLTLKQYQKIKLLIVVILAIIFSQLVIFKLYLLTIPLLLVGFLLMLFLRRRVSEIIADERDYKLAGTAAIWAMQGYSWVAVVAMFFFYSLTNIDPIFESWAIVLAISVCGLLLFYSLIFKILRSR